MDLVLQENLLLLLILPDISGSGDAGVTRPGSDAEGEDLVIYFLLCLHSPHQAERFLTPLDLSSGKEP